MKPKALSTFTVLLALAVVLGACGPAPATAPPVEPAAPQVEATKVPEAPAAEAPEKYDAVLINGFMGNTWRPIMEREAQLVIQYPPLSEKIESLRIINTDNNATAQNVALASVILDEPDMILIDAVSETGSNQAIKEACDAGIVVVAFDGLVTEPCAWKIAVNFYAAGQGIASWLMSAIGGKGTIFWDLGVAGFGPIADVARGAQSVLDEYPDVEALTFYGDLAEGTEQQQVATLITAHPEVDGVLSFGYGSGVGKALQDAGHELVPMTLTSYNKGLLFCQENNVLCLAKSSPTYVAGSALMLGVDVLDGKVTGEPTTVDLDAPWYVNNDYEFINADNSTVYTIDEGADPDMDPGTVPPWTPPWLTAQGIELDFAEVVKPPCANISGECN